MIAIIRWWILALLGGSILGFIFIVAYYNREKIKGKYYQIRFPERTLRVMMHHPGTGMFRTYWRLIPDNRYYYMDGKKYYYQAGAVVRESEIYAYESGGLYKIKVDGREYDLKEQYMIKNRWERWPQIHYVYNCPLPINFSSVNEGTLSMSADDLDELTKNDFSMALLKLNATTAMLIVILLIGLGGLLIGLFNTAKLMGWVK